jgi:transcriptional regulator GlxA family with amidase domain
MAAHLLAASSLSVKEVAVKSGFWDDSHFHRHFHREYNQSPTEYRRAQHR